MSSGSATFSSVEIQQLNNVFNFFHSQIQLLEPRCLTWIVTQELAALILAMNTQFRGREMHEEPPKYTNLFVWNLAKHFVQQFADKIDVAARLKYIECANKYLLEVQKSFIENRET